MSTTRAKRPTVTFGQIEQLLAQLGFKGYTSPEGYKVLHQRATDALIMLPNYGPDDRMYSPHLDSIRTTLVHKGLIEDETLDAWLAGLHAA